MEKSDIAKFDDFLECGHVKVKYFHKISDVNKLRNCFFAFFILNIIIQGIDLIEKCCECIEKSVDEDKKLNSSHINFQF